MRAIRQGPSSRGPFQGPLPPTPPPAPFVNNDQPNPTLRKQAGWMGFGQTLLLTTLALVAHRGPLSTRAPARAGQQPPDPPNLLVSTLAATQAPFYLAGQPNPLLKPRTVQPEIPPNLTGGLQPPFNQTDWPNAVLRTRTVQPEIPPNLTGSLLPPFDQTDWPGAVQRTRTVQPDAPPNLLTNILGVVAAPFYQNDQPNPLLRIKMVQADALPSLLVTTLAATAAPFYQVDWQNPLPRPRTVQPEIPRSLTYGLKPPFYQLSWPNAVPRVRTVQPENPPNRTASNQPPFAQGSWPNPVIARQVQQPPQLSDYFAFTPNPIPFSLDNQPNPTLRTRTVQPENPQNLLPVQTTSPIAYARRGALSTRIPGTPQTKTDIPPNLLPAIYFVTPTKPFKQTEWPTHRRRFDLLSQVFDTTRYDDELYAFSQDNWPNPVLRVQKGYLQDYTNRVPLLVAEVTMRVPATTRIPRVRTTQPEIPINILPLTGPPVIPAKQHMWPNPAPKARTVQPEIPTNIALTKTAPIPPFYIRHQPNPTLSVSRYGYWVFQFDRLNLSLQPAVWSTINDDQTPAWGATGEACTADTTVLTADDTTGTADTDCSATWMPVSEVDGDVCTLDTEAASLNSTDFTLDIVCSPAVPTPWQPVGEVCTLDTTLDTLDTTLITLDTECSGWTVVDDSSGPGWTVIITNPAGTSSS